MDAPFPARRSEVPPTSSAAWHSPTNEDVDASLSSEFAQRLRALSSDDVDVNILACLCQARSHRLEHRAHLSLHLLLGLTKLAPLAWGPWIAWEMLLAGGPRPAHESQVLSGTPEAGMVGALSDALEAAAVGNNALFQESILRLTNHCSQWPAVACEVDALLSLMDPSRECQDPEVIAWRLGSLSQVPYGLEAPRSFGMPRHAMDDAETEAFVLAAPERTACRFVRSGLGLLERGEGVQNLAGPDEAGTGGTRTEAGIAVLALAGKKGVSYTDFVRTVYGVAFVPKRHQGMLDVLVHRMRTRLVGKAELLRVGSSRLVLNVTAPFVIPDGRTSIDVEVRLLRVLGALGGASAKQASEALGIPRRTAHRILQRLATTNSCTAEKRGGRVLYSVADPGR